MMNDSGGDEAALAAAALAAAAQLPNVLQPYKAHLTKQAEAFMRHYHASDDHSLAASFQAMSVADGGDVASTSPFVAVHSGLALHHAVAVERELEQEPVLPPYPRADVIAACHASIDGFCETARERILFDVRADYSGPQF